MLTVPTFSIDALKERTKSAAFAHRDGWRPFAQSWVVKMYFKSTVVEPEKSKGTFVPQSNLLECMTLKVSTMESLAPPCAIYKSAEVDPPDVSDVGTEQVADSHPHMIDVIRLKKLTTRTRASVRSGTSCSTTPTNTCNGLAWGARWIATAWCSARMRRRWRSLLPGLVPRLFGLHAAHQQKDHKMLPSRAWTFCGISMSPYPWSAQRKVGKKRDHPRSSRLAQAKRIGG